MKYDYSQLRGRIRTKYGTESKFAEIIGINRTTLSLKLTGKIPFTQEDITRIIAALDIPTGQVGTYFFTVKVTVMQLTRQEEGVKSGKETV